MAQGLHYAYGPAEFDEGIPASAFSKGDLLMYTSASSLSGLPHPLAASTDIAGVATADSTQSIGNKVTFIKANPNTVFWSACTPGSTFSRGASVNFNLTSAGRPIANGSTGTVRAICERGPDLIPQQSNESRILVRLIGHDGNLTHV